MSPPPLRAVVVGAGAMGREWIRTAAQSPDVELVAVVDTHLRSALAATETMPATRASDDLASTLQSETPDLIINVTVPEAHYAVSGEALRRGIHVLSEKPLCATLREAVRLDDEWGAGNPLLAVSQSRRYNTHMFALRDAVRAAGRPHMSTISFYKNYRPGGFREVMDHPLLLDMAIHPFDGIRFVLGSDPVAVRCVESNPRWSWFAGAAVAHAWFQMCDGSSVAYDGNWCNLGNDTSWNSAWRVCSEQGSVLWDGESAPLADTVSGTSNDNDGIVGGAADFPGEGLAGALAEFVASIRGGRLPMGHVSDNVISLAMVHAAIRSASLGGESVTIESVLDSARRH